MTGGTARLAEGSIFRVSTTLRQFPRVLTCIAGVIAIGVAQMDSKIGH